MVTQPFGGAFNGTRALVTGHTGFKGAWLTLWLRELGAQVTGISLPDPPSAPNLFDLLEVAPEIQDLRFDLADFERTKEAISEAAPDVVFHLAAQPLVLEGYANPHGTIQTNVLGATNVLEAVRAISGVRSVVIATTDKCYRPDDGPHPFVESDPLGGLDPYSASKAAAEMVCAAYRQLPAMPPVATIRAGNVLGGGDWGAHRLVPDLIRAWENDEPVLLRNPESVRPWQDILDCLGGYLRVSQLHLETGTEPFGAYNIGPLAGARDSVSEIIETSITALGGGTWKQVDGDPAKPENPVLFLDATRAVEHLGWRPRLTGLQAASHAAEWYRRFYGGESAAELCHQSLTTFQSLAASSSD
jgi:CDP-glucose 4,6-dehydratase